MSPARLGLAAIAVALSAAAAAFVILRRPDAAAPPRATDAPAPSRPPIEQRSPEPASRPVAAPVVALDPAPAPAPSIPLEGRVVLVADDGSESHAESGTLRLTIAISEDVTSFADATIDSGRFTMVVPRTADLIVDRLVLGGRPARVEPDAYFRAPESGVVTLTARRIAAVLLHVIGADTRADLENVMVVRSMDEVSSWSPHPGDFDPADVVVDGATSPVWLARFDPSQPRESFAGGYFIRAEGYAWKSFRFVGEPDERTVVLDRSGDLAVSLENYHPSPGASDATLRRLWSGFGDDPPTDQPLLLVDTVGEVEDDAETVVVTVPLPEGPTRIEGLAPGPHRLEVVLDRWADDPIVLGAAAFSISAGETTSVALVLADPPEIAAAVPLSGTLFVPESWGATRFSLSFEPQDVHGLRCGDSIEIGAERLVPVDGSPRLFAFDAGRVLPGRYVANIVRCELLSIVDVGPSGRDDVHLALPEAADVALRFVSAETGEEIVPGRVYWHASVPSEVNSYSISADVPYDADAKRFLFRCAAGAILIQIASEFEHDGLIDVVPGRNDVTIPLARACGVVLSARCGDEVVPLDALMSDVEIECVGGEGRWSGTSTHRDGGLRVQVSRPGTYVITFDPPEGFEPVGPFRVEVLPGEFAQKTIELRTRE